jgi:hypothetical protein
MGLETLSLVSASIEDGAFEKENDFETKAFDDDDDDDDTSSFSEDFDDDTGARGGKVLVPKADLASKGL